MKKITKEWLKKADGDYRVSIKEYNSDNPVSDAICYHAHQCIEKYMKAILIENNINFEKIHDLEVLLKQCKDIIPLLINQKEGLIWLTQYSIRIRYPGFNATKNDAKKAVEIMIKIRNIIRQDFGLEEEDLIK